jgi:lipase
MRLHVHEFGDPAGPPVVCLHGLTGHGRRFRKLGEERLADRRVIAPDMRGHGGTAAEPPWTTAAHVGDVLETMSGLGVEEGDWIGFSFGGLVAAALAIAAPERVRRLVLIDPALHLPPADCLEQAEAELEDVSFADADEAIEVRLGEGTLFHTPREMLEEEMRDNLVRGDDGRLRYRYSRAAAIVAWSEMADTPPPVADVRTLIVLGDRSFVEVDVGRYPHAEVVTVPGGHATLWESFDATADAVARFLAAN